MKLSYDAVKNGLTEYNQAQVGVFISHIQDLDAAKDKEGKKKNRWIEYLTTGQAVSIYEKVALDGLYIDGDTITLQFKGKLSVSYNYQAYKNKMLMVYPESLFDVQLVYEGDVFNFEKVDGKVKYRHKMANPFNKPDEGIIGTYCIIKNSKGEFIETLSPEEIDKMRKVAKTDNIWKAWFGEMVLKSIIKRACKRHFKDVVTNIELLDNENVDPELVETEVDHKTAVEVCTSLDELQMCYERFIGEVKDEATFLSLLTAKKEELKAEAKKEEKTVHEQ
ncbi:recombinase RecT [Bacillus mycoides]|uniref:recombinase RecT n=1 Tax=Bacillus mycoides TaxID=1405 RepID=UPI003D648C4C